MGDNLHLFEVKDVLSAQSIANVTPFDVVSLVNTDVAIDFLPPKDAKPEDLDPSTRTRDLGAMDTMDEDQKQEPESATAPEPEPEPETESEPIQTTGHKLDDNAAEKKKDVEWFANIEGAKIVCDESDKSTVTRIQIILIGGESEFEYNGEGNICPRQTFIWSYRNVPITRWIP